jgi:hypothetical protein
MSSGVVELILIIEDNEKSLKSVRDLMLDRRRGAQSGEQRASALH